MTDKIAIIAWGAMADVLYATPIVRHVRQLHPEAHIAWLLRDKFLEVVETNPDINEAVPFVLPEGYASRQEAEHVMDRTIVEYARANYDKVYDLQYWPRYSNFFERPREDFISLRARNAGLDPAAITDRRIVLEFSQKDKSDAFRLARQHDIPLHPFIAVNHISYAASPVWSFENYQRLVNKMSLRMVFTGALNEPIPDNVIDARGLSYRAWALIISWSSLWLGLDSGAVALACASNVPIIKLHSPDFPLAKTGIRAMGLRQDENVLELCPAPNVEAMTQLILNRRKDYVQY